MSDPEGGRLGEQVPAIDQRTERIRVETERLRIDGCASRAR
jgi:hypothetical protein